MIFSLPLPTTASPFTEQSVALNGVEHVMTIKYAARTDRWYLSLTQAEGPEVVRNVLLQSSVNLLRHAGSAAPGSLYLTGEDPTLGTINTVSLIFAEGV